MKWIIRICIVLLVLLVGLNSCSNKVSSNASDKTDNSGLTSSSGASVSEIIRNSFDTLQAERYILDEHSRDDLLKELRRFYRFSNYKLRWCNGKGTTEETRDLLNILSLANEHGLDPKQYNVDHLIDLIDSVYTYDFNPKTEDVVRLDMSLSASYLSYAWHLYNGMVNPEQIQDGWHKANKNTEIAQYLAGKSLQESLEMIEPNNASYNLMRQRLETYISIANEGGWPVLSDTIDIKPGEYDENVYDLRDRLSYSSDYKTGLSQSRGSAVYDDKLVDAVKSFQKRHGLNSDGVINKETIEALNVPVQYRIAQIKINLERLRWMPRQMDDKYLLVNVPEFRLKIFRKNKLVDNMRVIVGRLNSPTPMINSEIDYLILSPTWAVPNQIFNQDVLPKVKKDPDYLDKAGYKLYASLDGINETLIDANTLRWQDMKVIKNTYKVIHTPAPSDNKKGGIKFVIPNSENLYLCDAPTTSLFDFSYRTFNYASISVEEPTKLARFILNEKKWNVQAIEENMSLKEPLRIIPQNKIPIFVTYLTSRVDENDNITFFKDIYGYDLKQAELMGINMSDTGFDNSFTE